MRKRGGVRRTRRPIRRRLRKRPADSSITGSNLLQTAVTVVVAVLLALAASRAGGASGDWQQSVRETVKRDAGALEDIRHVYLDEAPAALDVALAQTRADVRDDAEGAAQRAVAVSLRRGVALAESARYRLAAGGFDVGRRLADVRREHPDVVAIAPAATFAAGDDKRDGAMRLALAAIALVLGYLLVEALMRRRRRGPEATQADDVGLVPRPWSVAGAWTSWSTVALVAWLAITLLPALQLHHSTSAAREGALSSRRAVEIGSRVGGASIFNGFRFGAQRRVVRLQTEATSRLASTEAADSATTVRLLGEAQAILTTSRRGEQIVTAMARRPNRASGVDPATLTTLNTRFEQLPALVDAQRHASERAARAGKRADRVTLALVLAGLALSLGALGSTGRGTRFTALHGAGGALVAVALGFALAAVV